MGVNRPVASATDGAQSEKRGFELGMVEGSVAHAADGKAIVLFLVVCEHI